MQRGAQKRGDGEDELDFTRAEEKQTLGDFMMILCIVTKFEHARVPFRSEVAARMRTEVNRQRRARKKLFKFPTR